MTSRRQRLHSRGRVALAGLAVLLVSAGCGLKQDAVDSLAQSGTTGGVTAPGTAPGGGVAAPGTAGSGGSGTQAPGTSALGPGGTGSSGSGTTAPGAGSGGSGGSGSGSGNGGTTPGSGGSCGVPTGGDTTGISATTINLGLHAPLTGTGLPFPNKSFTEAVKAFWDRDAAKICGRTVQVEVQDDTYTPNGARDVCSKMARRDFLVVGGAGTDQIQACARETTIQRSGTPYLSAGVTTNGLTSLNNYFAVSLSYSQQGELVVRTAKQHGFANPPNATTGKKWALVSGQGSNFEDSRNGIKAALTAAGISYEDIRVDQGEGFESRAVQDGQRLALQRYKTIWVNVSPGYYAVMSGAYYSNGGTGATWTGPGIQYTQMTSAELLCRGSTQRVHGHAYFLAPNPGVDRASAAFKSALGGEYDSIMWIIWGLSEQIHAMLENASNNLTRQNFISRTLASSFPATSYTPITYNGKTHFGGTGAWVQRINCNKTEPNQDQAGTWDTVGSTYLRV